MKRCGCNLLFAISIFLISLTAEAAWDRACLDDCFSTKHECSFCAWMCQVDAAQPKALYPETVNDYRCPFINRDGDLAY